MEPEPFVIEHREGLIYMLCQAAELEQVSRAMGDGLPHSRQGGTLTQGR